MSLSYAIELIVSAAGSGPPLELRGQLTLKNLLGRGEPRRLNSQHPTHRGHLGASRSDGMKEGAGSCP